jgi:hypothetical protein
MSRANCTETAGHGDVQPIAQQAADEEPTDPAVAVSEGVNRLELGLGRARAGQAAGDE